MTALQSMKGAVMAWSLHLTLLESTRRLNSGHRRRLVSFEICMVLDCGDYSKSKRDVAIAIIPGIDR